MGNKEYKNLKILAIQRFFRDLTDGNMYIIFTENPASFCRALTRGYINTQTILEVDSHKEQEPFFASLSLLNIETANKEHFDYIKLLDRKLGILRIPLNDFLDPFFNGRKFIIPGNSKESDYSEFMRQLSHLLYLSNSAD